MPEVGGRTRVRHGVQVEGQALGTAQDRHEARRQHVQGGMAQGEALGVGGRGEKLPLPVAGKAQPDADLHGHLVRKRPHDAVFETPADDFPGQRRLHVKTPRLRAPAA